MYDKIISILFGLENNHIEKIRLGEKSNSTVLVIQKKSFWIVCKVLFIQKILLRMTLRYC